MPTDETLIYTDTDREFYLPGETNTYYLPIVSAESDNPNVIVEPTYDRTVMWYGEPISGKNALQISGEGTGSATFTISPKNISTCTVEEIVSLTANGTLDPRGTVTRAEVATVLVRFVEYLK